MQCVDVADILLTGEVDDDPEVREHVATCERCSHTARGLAYVDSVLRTTLVVTPPLDLQRRLAQIALDAARPAQKAWWTRVPEWVGELSQPAWVMQRPQVLAAQGLAAIMLALASWQIFGWISMFQPVVGDVGYAMELVAASPAAVYLGGLQLDLQTFVMWSLVGVAGWLISENGLIGRRFGSTRLQLP